MEKYILDKIVEKIPRQITPNMITLSNLILINFLCFFKLYKDPTIFSTGLFVYYVVDKIDGMHAISSNQVTRWGEILDKCVDGYSAVLVTYMLFYLYFDSSSSDSLPFSYSQIKSEWLYPVIIMVVYMFDIPYIIDKYSKYKLFGFTSNTIIFYSSLLPLFKYFTFSSKFLNYAMKFAQIVAGIYIGILLCQLFMVKMTVFDIAVLLLIGCLYFVRNIYVMSLFNGLIIMYTMTSCSIVK
jgi:phosphatidylglycerophosphate synthase